jgi:hypothetical protein
MDGTTSNTGQTEEYDGSAWTAGGNLGSLQEMRSIRIRNTNSCFRLLVVIQQLQLMLQKNTMDHHGLQVEI